VAAKICKDCGIKKSSSEFYRRKNASNKGRWFTFGRCKKCERKRKNAYNGEHKKRFPLQIEEYWYKKRYGITLDQYDRMFIAQNGRCVVCNKPETAVLNGAVKRLAVDHNHKTKKVRGLLCANCNFALGCAQEDTDILRNLIGYLEKHEITEEING
jgi:hypothetical protein